MADVNLGPTAQQVLELLRQNRGTEYGADDVCEVADCSTSQAQVALQSLVDAGLVERREHAGGSPTYVAR